MQTIKNTPEKIIMRMEANIPLANAIRRSIDEIPTLAIDEVEIFKNDSALFDEVLAHRLGLVPLKTDGKMNEKTSIDFKLAKTGPGTVYAEELKGSGEVVYDKIPITMLEKGQEIEVVATAKLGKGTEHAKYTPGIAYYRNLLEVKSKNPEVQKIIESSQGEMKPEKKGDTWKCDLTDPEAEKIKNIDGDSIKEADEILLFIESFGQMSSKDILTRAVGALGENLGEFEKQVK
jgi:DNA-directed RNA polymerase subunit D